jgi:hypothetical protein
MVEEGTVDIQKIGICYLGGRIGETCSIISGSIPVMTVRAPGGV